MANAFDDLVPPQAQAQAQAQKAKPNAFDDLVPPPGTPTPPPVQEGGGVNPWDVGGGNEPSIAARAPQFDPILGEQRRRFEAMNPSGALTPFTPSASFNTQPLIPMLPQPVRDFAGLGFNEASMAASPTLQQQGPAERARLGPLASGVAETLGYYASPTTWLNAVPGFGGALAGAAHEGIKSKFEGDDWTTAAEKAGKGALIGGASTGIAHVLASPSVVSKLVDLGGAGTGMAIAHSLFGDSPMATYMGGNMVRDWVRGGVKWAEEESGPLITALRPYLAAAIQGPASTIGPKQGWGPWLRGQ